ncbi:DUF4430 domain-containing protein [Neobacillus sp. FSL H8-0543]|uniref:DUF4430 domain-containing protein n=1 Tax=Neobacillus sp. FSL H8-0543 TaxID=2954672 RepID=UPI0031583000
MQRIVKSIVLLFVLLLTFSLIGCGTAEENANAGKEEEKTSEIVKKEEPLEVDSEDKKGGQEETTDSTIPSTPEKDSEQVAEQEKSPNSESLNTSPVEKSSSSTPKKPAATPSTPPETGKTPSTPPVTKPVDPPSTKPENPKPAATVTFSIVGPNDVGTILSGSKIGIKDGDTAFDVLKNATKQHGIQIETRGSGATAYVEGIDNYYEFDYGAKSGWVFELNGVSISKSIGTINVKDGDRIECYYTE